MFFPSIVTLAKQASIDAHHVVTYGTGVSTSCKYQEMSEKVIDQNGDEVVSTAWLMFPAGTTLNYNDKITLPSGATPQIASINTIHDHMGRAVSVEVFLTKGGSL